MLGWLVNKTTVRTKLSRVVLINKDSACTLALQREGIARTQVLEREGIKTSANDHGEEERAQDMESGNQMVKERGTS